MGELNFKRSKLVEIIQTNLECWSVCQVQNVRYIKQGEKTLWREIAITGLFFLHAFS